MENIKIAGIYVRVSSREQAEHGYSIDEQISVCKDYCLKKGIAIYHVYEDRGISGKTMSARPGILSMMSDAEKGLFNMVVVWRLSRVSRNQRDSLEIIDTLNKCNIEFKSLTETLETSTAFGKFNFAMLSSLAELERNVLAENVTLGMKAKARDGLWCGGKVLGYDLVAIPSTSKRRESRLEINMKEAEIIKKIFKLYYEGLGYKAIVQVINKEGSRTKRNNTFTVMGIRDILLNPIYKGSIRYNLKENWGAKKIKKINENPILVEGQHEAIIDPEVFDKVQEMIKIKSSKPGKTFVGSYYLSGLMRCPECNARMTSGKSVHKRKDGTVRENRYYYCSNWKNKGISVCRPNGVNAEVAEKYVFRKIERILRNQKLQKDIVNRINKERRESYVPVEEYIEKIEKEIAIRLNAKENYFNLMELGQINIDDVVSRIRELSERVKELEQELDRQKSMIGQKILDDVPIEVVKKVLHDFESVFSRNIAPERKKLLIHLFVEEVVLTPDKSIDKIAIKFNKSLVDYVVENGGLPKDGNPLYLFAKKMQFGMYSFTTYIK